MEIPEPDRNCSGAVYSRNEIIHRTVEKPTVARGVGRGGGEAPRSVREPSPDKPPYLHLFIVYTHGYRTAVVVLAREGR